MGMCVGNRHQLVLSLLQCLKSHIPLAHIFGVHYETNTVIH